MKKSSGFTLIELLVVIAIIAGVAALLFPQLRNFNRSQSLQTATGQLQTAFRQAQNNATAGVTCKANTAAVAWSLKFINASFYQIETSCADAIGVTPTPTPISTQYAFPVGVTIQSIDLSGLGSGSGCTIINVNYFVGTGISFNNISGAVAFLSRDPGCPVLGKVKLTITLQLTSDPNQTAKVVVEKGGSIYISSQ